MITGRWEREVKTTTAGGDEFINYENQMKGHVAKRERLSREIERERERELLMTSRPVTSTGSVPATSILSTLLFCQLLFI